MVMAVVIWYLIITLVNSVSKVPFIGKHLPSSLQYILAFGICMGAGWFVLILLRANINSLLEQLPVYQERFFHLQKQWMNYFDIKTAPDLSELLGHFNLMSLVSNLAIIVRDIARNGAIIIIYVLFLLLEHHSFDAKLAALIPDGQRLTNVRELIQQIGSKIQRYIGIKTIASVATSLCSYGVMRFVGVDFAEFWALLIFILNFIPTIGSIIATLFPCVLTLVQFDHLGPFILVTMGLIAIQFFIGSILEPRWMGQAFNLSGLVIITSLAVWGQVWGIVGMFLCIPITVIMNIILSNFPQTRPISVLLSRDGRI